MQERIKAASPRLPHKLRNTGTKYTGTYSNTHTQTYLHVYFIFKSLSGDKETGITPGMGGRNRNINCSYASLGQVKSSKLAGFYKIVFQIQVYTYTYL